MTTPVKTSFNDYLVRSGAAVIGSELVTTNTVYSITEMNTLMANLLALVEDEQMKIVQIKEDKYTSALTASAVIPIDDTKPLITEGVELISIDITPQDIGNVMLFFSQAVLTHSLVGEAYVLSALFDNKVHATEAIQVTMDTEVAGQKYDTLTMVHHEIVSDLNTHTVSLRVGVHSGNIIVNGNVAGRFYGATPKTNLIIVEVKVC